MMSFSLQEHRDGYIACFRIEWTLRMTSRKNQLHFVSNTIFALTDQGPLHFHIQPEKTEPNNMEV